MRKLGRGLTLLFTILSATSLPLALKGVTADSCLTHPSDAEDKINFDRSMVVERMRTEPALVDAFDGAALGRNNALIKLEFTPALNDSEAQKEHIEGSSPARLVKHSHHAAARFAQKNQIPSTDSEITGGRSKPSQADMRNYRTQHGDTLLKIVRDHLTDERFSLQQKMIAILRMNPEAFIGDNINNLKINRVLRLPDSDYTAMVSREAARAEVARQHAEWRESRTEHSPGPSQQAAEIADETPTQAKRPARHKEVLEGGVETPAPHESDLQQDNAVAPGYTDVTKLREQVDLMRARAESRQQDYAELSARNRELQEIIAQQDRLIRLQREEIAHLKQQRPEQADANDPDSPGESTPSTKASGSVKPPDSKQGQHTKTAEEEAIRGDTVSATIDFFTIAFILSGLLFFVAGSIGLLRLPDVYSRLHALTKADNVGLGLLVTGMLLLVSDWLMAVKLVLVWLLVLAASAASAHLIAQRARRRERDILKP